MTTPTQGDLTAVDSTEIDGKLVVNISADINGELKVENNSSIGTSNATETGDGVIDKSYNAITVTQTSGNIKNGIRHYGANTVYGNIVYDINGGTIGTGTGYTGDPLLLIGAGEYGGSDSSKSNVYGDVTINIGNDNGSLDDNFFTADGGYVLGSGTGTIHGSTNINIKSGKIGGVFTSSYGSVIKGDANITIGENAHVEGNIWNVGGRDENEGSSVEGNTNVNVKGIIDYNVYASTYRANSIIDGNATADIDGGTVKSNVVGVRRGLVNGDVNLILNKAQLTAENTTSHYATIGNVIGAYEGATIGKDLNIEVGGNSNIKGSVIGTDNATVKGNINVTLGGTANIAGDVYGGGYADNGATANVSGNVTVTLKDAATVAGTIYGGGANGATVEGSKTLNFKDYTGTVSSSGFDTINAYGTSDVIINAENGDGSGYVLRGGSATMTVNVNGENGVGKGSLVRNFNSEYQSTAIYSTLTDRADKVRTLTINGNIVNNLVDYDASGNNFYAGGEFGGIIINGKVVTNVSGDTKVNAIYAGNVLNQNQSGTGGQAGVSIIDTVEVNMSSGTVGSINGTGAALSDIAKDLNINITGGKLQEIDAVNGGSIVGRNVNINISGTADMSSETKSSEIYGGGQGTRSYVGGDVNIYIGGNSKFDGKIYGGGWYSDGTTIKGNINVTLAENAQFTGYISAQGPYKKDIILGTSTMNFNGYKSDNSLAINYFDRAYVKNASSVNFGETFTLGANSNANVMNVSCDSTIKATDIIMNADGSLLLTLGKSNQIDANVTNNGTFAITAKAGLEAGDTYHVATGSITGDVKTYGGTYNDNVFTVGAISALDIDVTGDAIEVADNGRVALSSEGNEKIEMDFNSGSATVKSVSTTTTTLISQIGEEYKKAAAYAFDVDMNPDDTVVLSFFVGDSSLDVSDFTIWHKNNGEDSWSKSNNAEDISDISYDGETLSFVVLHFSEYGFSAVPESSTYAVIFGLLALGFVCYRRRK